MHASICLKEIPSFLTCMVFPTAIENWRFKFHITSLGNYFITSGFTEALNSGLHIHRDRKFYTGVVFFFPPFSSEEVKYIMR